MTFTKFYAGLVASLGAVALSLTVYIWNANAQTIQAQQQAQDVNIKEVREEVKELRDIAIELRSFVKQQQELNEWHVSEHYGANRQGNR